MAVQSVKVDTKSLEKDLKQFMKAFDVTSREALDAVGLRTVEDAQRILNSQGTNNTGQLSQSIKSERIKGGIKVGTNTGYGLYVEFGRPAGKMPPRNVLLRWVQRKLGLSGNEAKSAAFFISKKIGKRGTKAQPFLRPAYERARKRIVMQYQKEFRRQRGGTRTRL